MLPICSPTHCASLSVLRVSPPGVHKHRHLGSCATPRPTPTRRLVPHMPCTCVLATRVRTAYFLTPANMCAQENPLTRLQLTSPLPSSLRSLPPTARPGTHRDRSLIHIFLLGADFSSRGDGQSGSSISGGLQGDSSMLSLCLRNRERRQHRDSASARSGETLIPQPSPFPPAAGADPPGQCL